MTAYTIFLALVALERLGELVLSRRHQAALQRERQRVYAEPMFAAMVALHVGVFAAAWCEVYFLNRPFLWWAGGPAAVLFVLATALRWWVILTLGQQWTVRVVAGSTLTIRTDEPFRYIRHPNYLGVLLEVASIPLIHTAYLTAIVFTVANWMVLSRRMTFEEQALMQNSDYLARMGNKPRLFGASRKAGHFAK